MHNTMFSVEHTLEAHKPQPSFYFCPTCKTQTPPAELTPAEPLLCKRADCTAPRPLVWSYEHHQTLAHEVRRTASYRLRQNSRWHTVIKPLLRKYRLDKERRERWKRESADTFVLTSQSPTCTLCTTKTCGYPHPLTGKTVCSNCVDTVHATRADIKNGIVCLHCMAQCTRGDAQFCTAARCTRYICKHCYRTLDAAQEGSSNVGGHADWRCSSVAAACGWL